MSFTIYTVELKDNSLFLTTNQPLKSDYFSEPDPVFSNLTNYCIPNSSNNLKSKLDSFIDGPCTPLIIVPGLLGSSLMVQIDCQVLKDENPKIFHTCGWDTCSAWSFLGFNIYGNQPKSEYQLWITDILSPLSMFSIFQQNSHCFNELIKLEINETERDNRKFFKTPKGINVTWFGNTPLTRKKGECGLGAIKDYSGLVHWGCDAEGFGRLANSFKQLGHINGLTFVALPYDFRLGVSYNKVVDDLKNILEFLYKITGKKVRKK